MYREERLCTKKRGWRRAVKRFLRLLDYEYCGQNDCPLEDSPYVPQDVKGYRSELFVDIVESYHLYINVGIPPSVEHLGRGGQNPLLLAAFRTIAAAEARKKQRDSLRDANTAAAAEAIRRLDN